MHPAIKPAIKTVKTHPVGTVLATLAAGYVLRYCHESMTTAGSNALGKAKAMGGKYA